MGRVAGVGAAILPRLVPPNSPVLGKSHRQTHKNLNVWAGAMIEMKFSKKKEKSKQKKRNKNFEKKQPKVFLSFQKGQRQQLVVGWKEP